MMELPDDLVKHREDLINKSMELFISRRNKFEGELKEIDATGHFEADDEIGSIFTGIKEIINDLQETLGEEVDAA